MTHEPAPGGPRRAGRLAPALLPGAVALVVIAAWQAGVAAFDVPRYIVPSPALVAATLVDDWPLLGAALGVTLRITLLALACAVTLGTLAAVLFVQSRWLERALWPWAVLLQVTPVVAIAPLVVIWVRDTTTALVVCATLVALFPVVVNTTLGLRSVPPGLVDLFRLHHASRWQELVRLRVPAAAPLFFGGLRIASGLALVGAVVAEFVAGTGGTRSGLAYQILQAGFQLNIPRLFAALVLIALAGIAMFGGVVLLGRLVLGAWHDSETALEAT